MDPKQFLSIKPIPSASHVGLKITARSSNPNYTCEYPRRPSVAKGNYRRRKYQIDNCGYRSVSTKPYQEVGNVVLDSRKLILSTLGQEEKPEEKEELSSDDDDASDIVNLGKNGQAFTEVLQEQQHAKELHTIQNQLHKDLNIMNKVKLGTGLFTMLDREKQKKVESTTCQQDMEKLVKTSQMVPANEDTDTEEEEEQDIRRYMVASPETRIPVIDENQDHNNNSSSHSSRISQYENRFRTQHHTNERAASTSLLLHSKKLAVPDSPVNHRKMFRRKHMPRPYSPIHTNVNFYKASSSTSLFRQLCVINWILEAMSQDNNPPVMGMISSCWNVSQLTEDTKLSQRRIEREKIADPIWQSFMSNPSRFQSKSHRYKVPGRKNSIRPSSLLNFSMNSSRSKMSDDHRSVSSGNQTLELSSSLNRKHGDTQAFKYTADAGQRDAIPEEIEKEKNNLEESSSPPSTRKHIQWKKIRGAYNFNTSVSDVVLMRMKRRKTLEELSLVPGDVKEKFADIKNEQAVILHDNLELIEKHRWASYEKKFFALNVMRNVYETLDQFRENGKIDFEDEPIEMKVESKWYADLMKGLPQNFKEEKNISLILKKIQRFCDIEGRKISGSHFLRSLSILRPFELCYPDISAGIEFVRDKIVEMDKTEFEAWCKKHIKRQQRSKSAPPSTKTNF